MLELPELLGVPEVLGLPEVLGVPEVFRLPEADELIQLLGVPEAEKLIQLLGVPIEAEAFGLLLGVLENAAELVSETEAVELLLIKLLGLSEERGENDTLPVLLGLLAAERVGTTLTLPEDTPDELRDCVLLGETVTLGDILQTEVAVPQLALTLGVDDSDATSE